MSSKFLFLFLSTFLLVQSCLGKPFPEETTTIETDSDELDKPSFNLMVYVLVEFTKIADSTLRSGKKLFQDVIAEVSAMENKNEEITAKLEEYSKFIEKIDLIKNRNDSEKFFERFEIMGRFSDLLEKSNVTVIEKPTSTDKLFEDLLVKNGLINLSEQYEKKFETFAEDFTEIVDRLLKSETVEAWPQKLKIKDWLTDFKAEEDGDKKFAMFEKFFQLME